MNKDADGCFIAVFRDRDDRVHRTLTSLRSADRFEILHHDGQVLVRLHRPGDKPFELDCWIVLSMNAFRSALTEFEAGKHFSAPEAREETSEPLPPPATEYLN